MEATEAMDILMEQKLEVIVILIQVTYKIKINILMKKIKKNTPTLTKNNKNSVRILKIMSILMEIKNKIILTLMEIIMKNILMEMNSNTLMISKENILILKKRIKKGKKFIFNSVLFIF